MNTAKPFVISKKLVMQAYVKVKANKGSAGVDGETLEEFECNLKDNLYGTSPIYRTPPYEPYAVISNCIGVM